MVSKKEQKKNLITRILAAFLAVIIVTATPFEMQLDTSTEYVSVTIQRAEAQAADVITVKSANSSTLNKIHSRLSKGKAITLKVRGNESNSKKLLKEVNNKIKKVNKQGVVFGYKKSKTAGAYTYYTVNSDQAGTYQYAIKYIQKLYSLVRKSCMGDNSSVTQYYHDTKLYPDEKIRKLRWVYDFLVDNVYPYTINLDSRTSVKIDEGTYDARTTSCDVYVEKYYDLDYATKKQLIKNITYTYTLKINQYTANGDNELRTVTVDYAAELSESEKDALIEKYEQEARAAGFSYCLIDMTDENIHASGLTFDEFSKLTIAQELAKQLTNNSFVSDAAMIIYKTKDFCDLSDAMKVYAIAASGYFNCNFGRPYYGMVYDYTWTKYYGKKAMSTLYNNKAVGVCEVFATYECQVWDALGIQNYFNSSYKINHAWSVVKVKNSAGKVLWIPFDYGIGPAEGLAVDDATYNKYLKTEAMRYKLYLSNIKGAPKKKNFKDSDFK